MFNEPAEPRTASIEAHIGPASRLRPWAWALLALAFGLACTSWVNRYERSRVQAEQQRSFDAVTERSFLALRNRLESCEFLVRAVQSLFLASESVDAREFAIMFDNLQAKRLLPSLQALAFAQRVPRSDGDHYLTTMAEPLPRNAVILGLDINSQPENLRAALASRDTNQVAMSAPFRLRQQLGAGTPTDGIAIRLPVYAPGPTPRTISERRARMRGTIAASFRVAALIADVFPGENFKRFDVLISDVTDGASLPLYRQDGSGAGTRQVHPYRYSRDLAYAGRIWRVRIDATEAMQPAPAWTRLFWPGIVSSLLLAALAWSIASTRMRAIELGRAMGQRYLASEARFQRLNDLLPTLVLLADRKDDRIAYANQSARARLGLEALPVSLGSVFADGSSLLLTGPARGSHASDVQLLDAEGQPFWASASMTSVEIDGRAMWLMVASDVSEERRLTERLSYQASHDALTKLLNRQEFEARMERALVTPGRLPGALLFIDLDQFKLINDTSGHIAGDELLVQLALMMREQLRPDDMLARLGGDEFGVLLADIPNVEVGYQAAERLRRSLDGYVFAWEQSSHTVSASIGGVLTSNGTSMKELFAHADTACYLAKEAGRNRVHFYAEDDGATARRLGEMEWANRLRWAVKENRLVLDYQELRPIQDADRMQAPRVELLLRLREEDGRIVLPGAFLPAAERYGLMPLIDRWVVETALLNLDRLHPSGAGLGQCAINLSGASLEEAELLDFILEQIQARDIDPQRLCFEITETVAVRNFSAATAMIARLRGAGCSVALDDFGAGMSSFGYLKNLDVDSIKIDGSFVLDVATDPVSRLIVKAVTEIGHQRGLAVVAEWVSSEDMCALLAGIGVDYAQGFALHLPERVVFQRG